jgi:hypothetical protein
MSASTRTVQRTLGTSQLGGMIVLLAVLAAIVGAIAFSTIGARPADVAPAAGFVTPATIDYVPRHEIGASDHGQTDMSGSLMFQPPAGDPVKGGRNDERLRAR